LNHWNGDGIIARIENAAIAKALKPLKMPIVDVSSARLLPSLPWVETDDRAIMNLALQHFLDRGFRNFAFCGDPSFNWSTWRQEHFMHLLSERGIDCALPPQRKGRFSNEDHAIDALGSWLQGLPKPLAVMTCYDQRGRQILDACRRTGLAVPDEVAVMGVDNDDVLCDLAHPPLSSIIPNALRGGYEAANLLDRMMNGEPASSEALLIPPLGVATRQSTEVLAVEDPHVAKAVRFIREQACIGIGVEQVVRHAGLSRRLLEARFSRVLGHAPHEEIVRVQLQRVRELLTDTDLPLAQIAEQTGFRHVEYLSVVFKKKMGTPPSVYRQQHRPRGVR
jgi:LacI family transcriptional regulator